jgi:acyl-CoA reductase-like NAD-dependent aldehyde dehydrogenase
MFKLRRALIKAQDEIAFSVIEENGKPLNAAKIDVQKFYKLFQDFYQMFRGIKMVEYCCNIDNLMMGSNFNM